MIRKIIGALAIAIMTTNSATAQTNLLEQAGIKDWMSAPGSITELGNSYYILRRTLPAAIDTAMLPPNVSPNWDPMQLRICKYNKYTLQLEASSAILTGDTLQQDSTINNPGRLCIHKGRIHHIYQKAIVLTQWGPGGGGQLYTYYQQLDTNLNITVKERRIFTGTFPVGRSLIGMNNSKNALYIATSSDDSVGTFQKYYIIDTLGNVIESDILGYPAATGWIYTFDRYGTDRYIAYGINLLGVAQPEADNSFLITDSAFHVTDSFSTRNTQGVKMVATPTGALFTLSGNNNNALTEIGKYKPVNHFNNPSFFRGYGIDTADHIHAGMALSYNPYDQKIYSVSGTHKVDPYLGYCYFPATPQALQFPYGYSEIICTDTNLNLQWKKYIRIDQHTGGCGGPWHGIVPDGREGINIAGGWYNENYDGNGTDTINEFLYYITAATTADSTIVPGTAIDEHGIEIRDRVKMYPNPSTDIIWVDDIEGKLHEIKLYDVAGRVVLAQQAIGSKASVNITAIPPGLYLIRVTMKDGETVQKKIIKQ